MKLQRFFLNKLSPRSSDYCNKTFNSGVNCEDLSLKTDLQGCRIYCNEIFNLGLNYADLSSMTDLQGHRIDCNETYNSGVVYYEDLSSMTELQGCRFYCNKIFNLVVSPTIGEEREFTRTAEPPQTSIQL